MKIDRQERITVHDEEVRKASEVAASELDSTRGPEGIRFSRIFNRNGPVMPVTELAFDLISQIAGAHHQAAISLRPQLPDKEFEE